MHDNHHELVLLVDDEAENLEQLAAILGNEHTKVVFAGDGPAALEAMAATRPDVVLVNIDMPGMDGFETVRRMPGQRAGGDIPVIFLAAADNPALKAKAFKMKAADLVTKPFQPEEVRTRVEKQLRFNRLRRQLEEKNRQLEQEIAEHRRSEVQLREANAIVNESPAVAFLWCKTAGWPVEFATKNVRSLVGYGEQEFVSGAVRYADIVHPDDLPRVTREVEAASREPGAISVVHEPYRIVTKDGTVKWVDDRTSIRRDMDGAITHYRGVVLDITERKLVKEALRKAGRSYKMLSQCGQALIHAQQETPLLNTVCNLLVDSGGFRMAWVGKKVHDQSRSIQPLAYAGYEQGYLESVGVTWAEDRPRGQGPAGQVLRSGQAVVVRHVIDDPNFGPWRAAALRRGYRSVLGLPLWVEGEIYGCLVIYAAEEDAFDTEEMELLGALADDLAFGIGVLHTRRKRIHALRALEQAKVTAEAADRAKGEFLANMSHEIRTPLNAVTGLTRLALNTELSDKQRNYLENIDLSAHALLGVINDILDFAKIEAGKLDLARTDFALVDVLEKLPVLLGLPLEEKDLELLFEIGRGVPRKIRGDSMRLTQVLLNLVGNAVKFTDRGEITVTVDLARAVGDEVFLNIEVADTGIGIPADKQGALFDAFSQVDSSDTRKAGGTGLGLAICRRLVDLMGGTLEVDSEPGKGSRFWFTAHFGRPGEPEELPPLAKELRGARVLAADDNAEARDILARLLGELSLRPTLVDSGEAMLRRLEIGSYDLAMIDCKMPGLNGAEIAKRIRGRSPLRRLPLIAMRNALKEESSCAADSRWFTANLAKPVLPEALLYALTHALTSPPDSPPDSPPVSSNTIATPSLEAPLRDLAGFLEKGSTRALTCLPGLKKAMDGTGLPDDYAILVRQVEDYHFKEALETMRRLSRDKGAGLHRSRS